MTGPQGQDRSCSNRVMVMKAICGYLGRDDQATYLSWQSGYSEGWVVKRGERGDSI